MRKAVIATAVRTPIGNEGGALRDISAESLSALVIREVVERAGIPSNEVDDVIWGQCLGEGGNHARLALLKAGLPVTVPGVTLNRQCTSGLEAINLAAQAILLGHASAVVAGGVENMTRQPYMLEKPSRAYQRNAPSFIWGALSPPEVGDPPMGITAENLAERYEITREMQDEFALRSHRLASAAIEAGRFRDEIIAVTVPQKKKPPLLFDTDEHPRADTSLERLNALSTVFKPDGTVTAGNSSGIADGAAATLILSDERASLLGLTPLATIRATSVVGVDPNIMGIAPSLAIPKALTKLGLGIEDMDLLEINEAFAAQVLAVCKESDLTPFIDRINVNGGAIALGHPIGCTGCRLVVTLIHEMARRDCRYGLVSLCAGGGQGMAMVIERESR
jgi:acetyl-CoA C-acetyltransferase